MRLCEQLWVLILLLPLLLIIFLFVIFILLLISWPTRRRCDGPPTDRVPR
jgi:hypothetical protein